ncbi:carboxymuconolactone decarboxylase family protein [Salipaludibacillus agaradhaerens]|uniref:carboxymuconolactone decarboxylase family protein n=1 Tax=Salipaludibacillus agaradhaerens TaxID=76935 RepID=UPI0021518A10|nr:carboxymuconolactone decarboxylase family protein [Salipaludibacillus agaradhaerens]MCR6105598.1 carboxymuconolactone decarboxylase family protein [Salipaludibacillus agaradhaerens]MCR6117635.1 carboxymuconolactone decarboxylase family protein [Salipaludibacillus agaradhaerens]
MPRIKQTTHGDTPFQQLLGHNVQIMTSWNALGDTLERDGRLTSSLKEQVRRTLAQKNGCDYCKAKGKPDKAIIDERTVVATGFADVFLTQKGDIPDSVFKVLKDTFSDEEISELIAFITFTTAQQYFGAIMQLEG